MRVRLKGDVGHHMRLVPFLRGDDVLCVREPEVVGETGLGVLELDLSHDRSLCGGEGSVGLLIRDDGHIIGWKPSALLTEQTIPPPRFEPSENLDDVVFVEGKGGVVIGLIVEEGAAEKGREELFLLRLLLGRVGAKRHDLCSRTGDFGSHCQSQRLAWWWLTKLGRQWADTFPARMAVLEHIRTEINSQNSEDHPCAHVTTLIH